MTRALVILAPLFLLACGEKEPERPSTADEQRFEEIDAMLDEEKGAAPEDATPSKESGLE